MKSFFIAVLMVMFCMVNPGTSQALTADELQTLMEIRAFAFGGFGIDNAMKLSTINGEQPPIFRYDANERAVITWKVAENKAAPFAKAINLRTGMSLAKSVVYQDEVTNDSGQGQTRPGEPGYYIILDIHKADGITRGTKLEWKTFVTVEPDPVPRLLRFDTQSAILNIDPLKMVSPGFGFVRWSIKNNTAKGFISNGLSTLILSIPMKHHGRSKTFTQDFVTAHEIVYSPKGASARYFVDESIVATPLISVKPQKAMIINWFRWAAYVDKVDAILFPVQQSDYLVQPVTTPVDMDSYEAGLFGTLIGMVFGGTTQEKVLGAVLKKTSISPQNIPTLFYAVLDLFQSLRIFMGFEEPKMFFQLADSPPAIFINFEIPEEKVQAFTAKYLPEGFSLAKMKFYPEQQRECYAISLNVYVGVGAKIGGNRAEWQTYIMNPKEENPEPRFFILETQSATAGFDAMYALENYDPEDPMNIPNIIEPPAEVFTYSVDETSEINIQLIDVAEEINVEVAISYPDPSDILVTKPYLPWMLANTYVYWGEISDEGKWNSRLLFPEIRVFDIGPNDIVVNSAFADYLNPEPLPILMWTCGQDVAVEPWSNVDELLKAAEQ